MKKIFTSILSIIFVLSFTSAVFANDSLNDFSQVAQISEDGEVIAGLIPLPDNYPVPLRISNALGSDVEGFYIAGDGVAARRPYGLKSPIIGRLNTGDIVWTSGETARADGYKWLHVDTHVTSSMGKVVDVWIVTKYIGEPW